MPQTRPLNPPARPPRVLTVVREPVAEDLAERIDWSAWYLTDEEDMGQSPEQGAIAEVVVSILRERTRELGWDDAYVHIDQFFGWVPSEPLVRVSPDAFILRDCPSPPLPASWQTWRPGHHPPSFAVEIVSEDWKKDYHDGPLKYAQLGVEELVIFDPAAARGETRGVERVAIQVYRRAPDGLFVRHYAGRGPARSEILDVFLVSVAGDLGALLRLARDPEGRTLVPTQAERLERERDEASRQRDEASRQRDIERTAREALEREIAALRARLAERD